ncbi:molybdate ABC transporter substrate-binding protein [Alteromonas aestuariivivens]|nr:molybdate ABC transporter substrate-binding protein [Alteromonas aestuariivivens]
MLTNMRLYIGLLVTLVLVATRSFAAPLHLAVAANFAQPAKALCNELFAAAGEPCLVTVASSGTLYAQIVHGAPFDVFLSADTLRPAELDRRGLVASDGVKNYAIGRLAYVNRAAQNPSLELLATSVHSKLAMANPDLAPYGLAARQTLQSLSVFDPYRKQLVLGTNVLQAFQFYHSANVEQALTAWSLVHEYPSHVIQIPADLHEPIVQQLALLARASKNKQAKAFVEYLISGAVQARLPQWGYDPVSSVTGGPDGQ